MIFFVLASSISAPYGCPPCIIFVMVSAFSSLAAKRKTSLSSCGLICLFTSNSFPFLLIVTFNTCPLSYPATPLGSVLAKMVCSEVTDFFKSKPSLIMFSAAFVLVP